MRKYPDLDGRRLCTRCDVYWDPDNFSKGGPFHVCKKHTENHGVVMLNPHMHTLQTLPDTKKRKRGREEDHDKNTINTQIITATAVQAELESLMKTVDQEGADDKEKLAALSKDITAMHKRWKGMQIQQPTLVNPRLLVQAPELLEKVQANGVVAFNDRFMSAFVNACLNPYKAFVVQEVVIELSNIFKHYKAMAIRDKAEVIETEKHFSDRVLYQWDSVQMYDIHTHRKVRRIRVVGLLQELQAGGRYDPDATLTERLVV